MKGVFFLKNIDELESIESALLGGDCNKIELILGTRKLSRLGELNDEDIPQAIKFCQKNNIPVFLEWDILMTENNFQQCISNLNKFDLSAFDAVRVQDIGAYHYLLKHTDVQVQLILESGNHNLVSILKWEDVAGSRLDRIILGIELPKNIIKKYTSSLKTSCELQVLGKILLFYSPRSLLARPLEIGGDQLLAKASSEESPHKGFSVIENSHGTFMFLPKDQFLMDIYSDVSEVGLEYLRFDHRFLEGDVSLNETMKLFLTNCSSLWESFKASYTSRFIRGYFNVNKSDAIFPKLKNYRTLKKSNSYIGKVVDVKKDQYLAISLFKNNSKNLQIGDVIEISAPDGKVKKMEVKTIKDISLKHLKKTDGQNIVLIPHVGGISVKSQVHYF